MTQDFASRGVKIGADEMIQISRAIGMKSGSLQCTVYENQDLMVHVANSRVVPNGTPVMAKDEPFHDYDFDYYLPTLEATTDRGTFSPGQSLTITTTVGNHGRPRKLTFRAWLEVGGTTILLGAGPLATVEALTGAAVQRSASAVVPASTPKGMGKLVVELDEAGTLDAVDYASVAVIVN